MERIKSKQVELKIFGYELDHHETFQLRGCRVFRDSAALHGKLQCCRATVLILDKSLHFMIEGQNQANKSSHFRVLLKAHKWTNGIALL